jgi:glycosyltransferase involved in cell wall biosynthesis
MSMGCACVVSDIPANWSVVTPDVNGLMFRKNDADDLADRIIQLVQSPFLVRKLGGSARDTIESEFSIDVVAKKYVNLYSQLTVRNF